MNSSSWGLLALYLVLLLLAAWPLGIWLARLSSGNLSLWMQRIEAPLYRLAGTAADKSMDWSHYALAVLAFNALGVFAVYALQRLQVWLPLNPAGMANVSPDSAFNTAVSFVTNTNWQGYSGETTMSYLLQMLAIFLIPAALCFAFGREVGDLRQGWAVLAAMTVMFVIAVVVITPAEQAGNPLIGAVGVDQTPNSLQSGGNMEGKEVRYGINASSLFAVITTAASCGAVNAMHDSFTPLGGMVPMVMMQLGEVVFGGVGSGLYGMLVFAILAVFIAGLMIGRTPEYLGKKIESHEMKLTSIAILVTPIVVLVGTAIALLATDGKAGIANPGAHVFSEIFYALSSAANNNGSAFAGLSVNTPFYNWMLAVVP